jgi:hypothetical protein
LRPRLGTKGKHRILAHYSIVICCHRQASLNRANFPSWCAGIDCCLFMTLLALGSSLMAAVEAGAPPSLSGWSRTPQYDCLTTLVGFPGFGPTAANASTMRRFVLALNGQRPIWGWVGDDRLSNWGKARYAKL